MRFFGSGDFPSVYAAFRKTKAHLLQFDPVSVFDPQPDGSTLDCLLFETDPDYES